MRKYPSQPSPFLTILILMLFVATGRAQDAVTSSNVALENLDLHQQALIRAESEFGPFDLRLLEVLLDLEQALEEQGELERVLEIQTRRLQILRSELGLEHPDTLPVLEQIIDTRTRMGQWQEVSDNLEHRRHILVANHGEEAEVVLQAMAREADWFLARVAWDEERNQADNFLDARDLYEDILRQARDLYGDDDPALQPWLYARAYSLFLLVDLINAESPVAGPVVDELVRRDGSARLNSLGRGGLDPGSLFGPGSSIPIVEEGRLVGEAYLRQALGYIDDIREFAEARGDTEMQAMATLYHGDFQRLLGRGTSRRDYRRARESLMEAGIAQSRIDALLARPQLIPLPHFHSDFAALEAERSKQLAEASAAAEGAGQPLAIFTSWHERAANTPRPADMPGQMAWQEAMSEVTMDLRINSRGQVTSVDIQTAQPDEGRLKGLARRAARALQFRPALEEGRPVSVRDQRLIFRVVRD